MRKIEITVIKIQQFLNAIEQIDKPEYAELAEMYADMCDEVNNRLEKCREEILRNSPETAIHLAEKEPPLLEMVELLNFDGVDEWHELCELYEWKIALPVDMKLVAELKRCYGNRTALEPLLIEYRKQSRRAPLKEKIALLRKIKAVDSENIQWENDLARFENERLEELKKIGRKAIEEDDEITIRSVYDEVRSPGWFVSPPSNVVSKLKNELIAFRKMRLKERGKRILHELTNAYSNYSMDEVAAALNKWDMLLREEYFSPDKSSEKQVAEARRWFDEENAQLETQRLFDKLLRQFADDMDNKKSLTEIDNLYHKLLDFDMPLPSHLVNRYKQVRSDLELEAKRTYTKKLVIALVFVIAIIALLGYFIHLHIRDAEYRKWAAPILKASEEYNLTDLKAAMQSIAKLKTEHPDFYDTEIVQAESTIRSLISEIKEERKQCEENLNTLDAIISSDYKDYDKMEDLIKSAELLTRKLHDDRGRLRLEAVKKSKRAYELRTQDERDSKFTEDALALNKLLMKVESIDAERQPAEFEKALAQYDMSAKKILSRKGVNPEIFKKYATTINANIQKLNREFADSKERGRQKRALMETIETEKLNLPAYSLALQRFVNKFPEDRRSMEFLKILKMMPGYLNAVALQHLSPESIEKKGIQKYAEFLKTHPAKNIWRRDLKEFLEAELIYLENRENIIASLKALQNLQVMKYRVLRFKNSSGDKICFYTSDDVERKFSSINTTTFTTLRTDVLENDVKKTKKEYFFQQHDKGWDVTAGRVKLYRNLEAVDDPRRKLPLAAHSLFCNSLNIDVAGRPTEEYEPMLLKKIDELKSSSEINSFLKLQLLQRLYALTEKISISNKEALRDGAVKLKQLIQACDNVNWVSIEPKTKKRIDDIIAALPKLHGKVKNDALKFKTLKAAVGRKLKEVGTVSIVDGKVDVSPIRNGVFRELWVLIERNGVLKFCIVGKKDATGIEIFPKAENMLMDGEPIFAPFDGRSTRDLSDKFFQSGNGYENIRKPDSWPVEL